MAHEMDRLFNEIAWAISDKVAEARGSVSGMAGQFQRGLSQAQDVVGEQWAEAMVRTYASKHRISEGQSRTALILLGVVAASKSEGVATPVPQSMKLRVAIDIANRAIKVAPMMKKMGL